MPVTEICDSVPDIGHRLAIRNLSNDDFIERYASGTLRKNKRLGMAYKSQLYCERVAFEFGYGFEMLPATRVNIGTAITCGDCHAISECGWHCDRLIETNVFSDKFEVCHIVADGSGGKNASLGKREGIGVYVKSTSAKFIPSGHIVFAIIAFEENGQWKCINPC